MNNISIKQNEVRQLNFLFTQRQLYSEAKTLFAWRTIVAVLLAILGPILTSLNNDISIYSAIIVVIYLIIDNSFLEKLEISKKTLGAKVQELFDTTLFELDWNPVVAGKKPDNELMCATGASIDYSALKLIDWYSSKVSAVELWVARFLCQRSNVWWDSALRKKYLNFLYSVLAIVLIILIILGSVLNVTIGLFFLGIVLPVVPLLELLIKQINEHHGSDCCSTDLKENLNDTLTQIAQGRTIEKPEVLARTYQDEIYRHRSKCPMVFDWMYWIFRDRQEKQMLFSIEDEVNKITK